MYCINCGVKLADSEKQCPLCGVRVFHPELTQPQGEKLYPRNRYPEVEKQSRVPHAIVTALFLLPIIITLLCDMRINNDLTWSGYVSGALVVAYVIMVLPYWFRKPNPVIFVPCGFVAVGLYLLYINYAVKGQWFMTLAFPLVGGVCLIVTAVVTLLRYVGKGELYIFGGASIALGGLMLLTEFLVMLTFSVEEFHGWSLYPLVALVLLGGLLIFLAICRPAREMMERKTFI